MLKEMKVFTIEYASYEGKNTIRYTKPLNYTEEDVIKLFNRKNPIIKNAEIVSVKKEIFN